MKRPALHIGKIIATCLWLIAGAGVIVLLIAAANSRKERLCKGYEIRVNGKIKANNFLTEKDIVNALSDGKTFVVKDKRIESVDLYLLESRLQKQVWIKDAELYFDNQGILKIKVEEREPIAKIYSVTGDGFFIDSSGHWLPLNDKKSLKLPVFTGFPNNGKKIATGADKKLVGQVKEMGTFLLKDTFWMNQIETVHITQQREFELWPVSAKHIIEFGNAEKKERKFNKLKVFYSQVLPKTGLDKYKRIKVQYDKQVIGVKE